jgi:hypothetical protein
MVSNSNGILNNSYVEDAYSLENSGPVNGNSSNGSIMATDKVIIREGVFLLAVRYFVVYFVLLVINIMSALIIISIDFLFLFTFLILFNISVISLSGYIFLQWKNNYFIIMSSGIQHKKGVWDKHEENYSCDNIETIMLDQSWMGRVFRYGTIKLYDPALQANILLYNIHSPRKITQLLRRLYLDKEGKTERSVLVRGAISSAA